MFDAFSQCYYTCEGIHGCRAQVFFANHLSNGRVSLFATELEFFDAGGSICGKRTNHQILERA